MSDYKHEWINEDARYVIYNESGSVVESENYPTNSTFPTGKVWFLENVQRQEERTVYQRYTDQQMELEAQGWTIGKWRVEPIDGLMMVEALYVGDKIHHRRIEIAAFLKWDKVTAYRLSNVDDYINGVKTETNGYNRDSDEAFGKKLSVNDKPEWKAGEKIATGIKLERCVIVNVNEWKAGDFCELSNCGNGYTKCEILFISAVYVIVQHSYGEQHYHTDSVKFRPIQTDKERVIDLAIESINSTLESSSEVLSNEVIRLLALELSFDKLLSMPKESL